jgi:beta-lactamase class D
MRKYFAALLFAPLLLAACSTNNVTVDDSLGRVFDSAGVKGCFALFDNGQGHFTIFNLPRYRDSAYDPGATFDLVQGLIALQTGVVTNDTSEVDRAYQNFADNMDSAKLIEMLRHPDTSGNRGTIITLEEIMQEKLGGVGSMILATRIGKDTLKRWVDSLHYGNRDIRDYVDTGHLDGHLRITPDEQLGLTKKLYFDQLPFFPRPQQLVKDMLSKEGNSNYKLVYKTGRAALLPGPAIGWVMGWAEENGHPYFFVVNVESPDGRANIEDIGIQVAKNILSRLGFFRGKK